MTNTIIGNGIGPSYTISTPVSGANITWTTPNTWTTSNAYTIPAPSAVGAALGNSGKLSLQGENADIVINGESLVAMLKRIEERMNILSVNHDLEEEWEELRALGEQYRELEKHIIEKMKTWDKLKAQDNENR